MDKTPQDPLVEVTFDNPAPEKSPHSSPTLHTPMTKAEIDHEATSQAESANLSKKKVLKRRPNTRSEKKENSNKKRKAIEVSPHFPTLQCKPSLKKPLEKPIERIDHESPALIMLQDLQSKQAQLNALLENLQIKLGLEETRSTLSPMKEKTKYNSNVIFSNPKHKTLLEKEKTLLSTNSDYEERKLEEILEEKLSIMDKNIYVTAPSPMDKNIDRDNAKVSKANESPLYLSQPQHQKLEESDDPNKASILKIFWKGVILTPTRKQLLLHKGKLDSIKNAIGFRKPKQNEWNLPIAIDWKGSTLFPTPTQLLKAGGNLHILEQILSNPGQSIKTRTPRNYSSKRGYQN